MRIGVIGAGKIGRLRIRAARADPGCDLAAVLDVNASLAEAAVAGSQARAFTDLAAFLDAGLDAVIVSTPPHLHQEACTAAFARGAHVLCEKPLSNSVAGAQAIVDAAVAAGRVLAVGFNLRYYPFVTFMRAAIDRGEIGTIDHVRVFGGHNGLHNFSADWQYRMPWSGGGAMMDIGIHMTDLARYFLGEITSAYGVMSETVWQVPGSEDNAMAIFRNPAGLTATYHTTWTEWKGYKSYVEVYGNRGMVRGAYAPMQNLLIAKTSTDGPTRKTRRFYPEVMLREKLKSWQETCYMSFQDELRDFQARIAGNRALPLADGHAGLRAIELAQAVRDSSASGQPVTLKAIGDMAL